MHTATRSTEIFLTLFATLLVLLSQACAAHHTYGPREVASNEISRASVSGPYQNDAGECVEDFELEVEKTSRTTWRVKNRDSAFMIGGLSMAGGGLLALTYNEAPTVDGRLMKLAGGGALFTMGTALVGNAVFKMLTVPDSKTHVTTEQQMVTEASRGCSTPRPGIASASEPETGNVEQRLERLKSLKDQGLISQENFERRQREILDGI